MTNYYQHINDFEDIVPIDNAMPVDVKQLISHCNHTFHKRFYFFSPSEKKFYRYYPDEQQSKELYSKLRTNGISPAYRLTPDISFKSGKKIRDDIIISKHFIKRIEQMNKLIISKAK